MSFKEVIDKILSRLLLTAFFFIVFYGVYVFGKVLNMWG